MIATKLRHRVPCPRKWFCFEQVRLVCDDKSISVDNAVSTSTSLFFYSRVHESDKQNESCDGREGGSNVVDKMWLAQERTPPGETAEAPPKKHRDKPSSHTNMRLNGTSRRWFAAIRQARKGRESARAAGWSLYMRSPCSCRCRNVKGWRRMSTQAMGVRVASS